MSREASTLNPRIECKSQFVLIAPVLKNSSIGAYRRNVEPIFPVFVIDDLVAIRATTTTLST